MTPRLLVRLTACLLIIAAAAPVNAQKDLAAKFRKIPDTIQTSIYWYWISGNISKEGVVKDLQAMKRAGINRAFIGNIALEETPSGKVKMFTDEWWDIVHTALKTATDLHIDIGFFNSPGWSQSGGPWVRPGRSMRYVASTETRVSGPGKIDISLERPSGDFQDTRTLAFPAPRDYTIDLRTVAPAVTSIPAIPDLDRLIGKNDTAETLLPAGEEVTLTISSTAPFPARSLVITPGHRAMRLQGEVQAKQNESWSTITTFSIDRSNPALNTGFSPYAPASIALPATTAQEFRIVFKKVAKGAGIRGLSLRAAPMIGNYAEKTLAKMYPTPLPYWKEYQWPAETITKDETLLIDPAKVLDISSSLSPDGSLHWTAPAGDWVIMRFGMLPTGVNNAQAPPEGKGLEVDKMSRTYIAEHFDAFLGQIIRHIPAADRKSFRFVVADSYETGSQNWTDDFIQSFKAAFHYDPLPYLPVFSGKVVGNEDLSDRFLWDVRRFVADKVAYDYVGGLRDACHKYGLTTWLENYGHWGFPGEFLQYGGQSDEIGGEFWSEGELGNIENRAASSSAHIYGKTKVSAESFTAGGKGYFRYPALLKQRGDRFFTEGINNTLLHVYIHQPDERKPGINAGFGTEFNRYNTWFSQIDLFTSYLKRCNWVLQQGRYVADVAFFIGEDAPKMTGVRDPELPAGYSFDYINAEVIEKRLTIRNGRWTLPDGLSYGLLVLPKLTTMRPALLRKLRDLVQQGGVLFGPAPDRSPSLENYQSADREIRQMAAQLWKDADEVHRFGKGSVIRNASLQPALDLLKISPDFIPGKDSILFIHRVANGNDIYFISNQSARPAQTDLSFRVQGKRPQFWDPLTGAIRDLPEHTSKGMYTTVPVKLDIRQSAFIIFSAIPANAKTPSGSNFPDPVTTMTINAPWTVTFDTAMRGPAGPIRFDSLTDWSKRPEDAIRNYSGTAVYRTTFNYKGARASSSHPIYIDLGQVCVMAKCKVNGTYVGGVWTPPYRIDITKACKPGENELEIELVNTWVNRLIGDAKLPADQRKTFLSHYWLTANSSYQPSGLLGPVTIQSY